MEWNDSVISEIVQDVYNDINHTITSSDYDIDTVLRQILEHRGKGLRPVFMALIGELMGGAWENLRKAAMVIETIHIASLIHDDVIDGSDLRRGSATLSVTFSDKISILFGDYVFIKALNSIQSINDSSVSHIIFRAVERMIKGEIHEMLCDKLIDEDTYLNMIFNKTASLFSASGELGAVLSGVNGVEKKWACELGESVGMAFQIIDDTLDIIGDTDVMGKPQLLDVMSGHITLPVIHSLHGMSSEEIEDIFRDKERSVEILTELVRSNRGIEYSFEKAREYSNNAKTILERFENRNALSAFDMFFDMIMTRTS